MPALEKMATLEILKLLLVSMFSWKNTEIFVYSTTLANTLMLTTH